MTDPVLPVTETANEITGEIDVADCAGIVRTLRAAEGQVYSGWRHHPGLFDTEILQMVERASEFVRAAVSKGRCKKPVIVLAGCGTSGRVAFLCARACNRVLISQGLEPCFSYLLGGGDDALILSIELPEDNPSLGCDLIRAYEKNHDRIVLIGISCGLSAPYVAGAVEYAMHHPELYDTVVIGFNPARLARNAPVEGWSKTCRDVFLEADAIAKSVSTSRCAMVTPVVGPEPITGSTRMKGGSATKALVDAICSVGLARALNLPLLGHTDSQQVTCSNVLRAFERTCRESYIPSVDLAQIMSAISETIRNKGRVVYLGDSLAVALGMMDASEMVDTYGCPEDEWRVLADKGWLHMGNTEGDISGHSPLLHIDATLVKQWVRAGDIVIHLEYDSVQSAQPDISAALEYSRSVGATIAHISVSRTSARLHSGVSLTAQSHLYYGELLPGWDALGEQSLKHMTNVISTGAQILRGFVFGNRMINVTVSNNKLYYRCLAMVEMFSKASHEQCELAFLRVIHNFADSTIPPPIAALTIREHIEVAVARPRVLSRSVLLAAGRAKTVEEADRILDATPVLRQALKLQ